MEEGILASSKHKEIKEIYRLCREHGISDREKISEITQTVLRKMDEGEQMLKAVFDEFKKHN